MRFTDKTAVVTGANSGIGRATATRLLNEGAQVLAVDVRHDRTWPDADAGRLRTLTLDIAADNAADVLSHRVQADYGRVDVLANVAGILHIAPFLDV